MTKEDIRKKIGQGEGAELEYKSAKGGFPESFWESFSAFANTHGGIIVFGIKEKDGVLTPDGLDDSQIAKYKKTFWDGAHNKKKVSATMLADHDLTVEEIDGIKFMVFRVPKAAYGLKPVFLNGNPFGNTYRRNHEGDYCCTDSEVRLMIADAESQRQSFDSKILPNYTIDDIDAVTLRAYRQRFMLRHENHPWNELDDMAFLTKIGAYHVNRDDGSEGFTRGGILMLGKTESITDPSCAPQFFVDYQEKPLADFYAGSHSICRNPTLQKLFMFLGNGEKAGSGADIIRKGWDDNHWPTPELSERTQPDETMMTLRLVGNENVWESKHVVGENVGEGETLKLTGRQRLVVDLLRKSPTASAKILSESLSVSSRTIERDLQKLTAMGAIVHKGGDFGGEWAVLV